MAISNTITTPLQSSVGRCPVRGTPHLSVEKPAIRREASDLAKATTADRAVKRVGSPTVYVPGPLYTNSPRSTG